MTDPLAELRAAEAERRNGLEASREARRATNPPGHLSKRIKVCARCNGRFLNRRGNVHSGTLGKNGLHVDVSVCERVERDVRAAAEAAQVPSFQETK